MRAQLSRIASIGTDFAVAVAACGFLGWLIDYWRGTQPWFLLGGLLLGLVVGFYRFIRDALAAMREPPGPR